MSALSPDHRLVKEAARLARPEARREARAFLVEGRRAIDAFLAAGRPCEALFVRDDVEPPAGWPAAHRVGARALAKLSQASTPSGYVARFALPDETSPDPASGGLVLSEVADPGNVGTLLRSAAAFGVADVVLVGGVDPWGAKVVQASAGALARLRVRRLPPDGFAALRAPDAAPLAALVVDGGEPPQRWPRGACWLIVGAEADGVRETWLAPSDRRWSLPMRAGVESLNAGVAGSIALYLLAQPS